MKYLKEILTGIGLLVFVSSAQAVDKARYNATGICNSYWASQVGDFNHKTTGLHNKATSPRWATCGIDVDSAGITTGTYPTWIHYQGTGQAYCTLYSYSSGGHSTIQTRSGSRTNTGWFAIPGISAESYWGNLVLYCKIPAGGLLGTIAIKED